MIRNTQARHHRHTPRFCGWFAAAGPLAVTIFVLANARGQDAGKDVVEWKTGVAFRQQLDGSVNVSWAERPLRDALASLSRTTQVAVLLDRRIDPEQEIELEAADQSLNLLFRLLAEELECGVGAVGSVVYLGPKATARKLASLAAQRRQQAGTFRGDVKAKLLKSQAWKWEEATEPRQMLHELAQQAGVKIENPEQVPHDLWAAGDLPALPWTDRLTLLLAGFDLTFSIDSDGQSIRLVSMPESAVVEKSYTPRGEAADTAAQLRGIVPNATIRVEEGKLHVAGSAEDHDKVAQLLSGKSVRTTTVVPGVKQYTVTIDNQPAGAVVQRVAKELKRTLMFDPQLNEKLNTKVSFAVSKAPLEELLEKALGPLDLTYKLDDQTLEIVRK